MLFWLFTLVWFYLTATILLAWAATEKGRSGWGWFWLSLFVSPVLCFLALIAVPSLDQRVLPPLNR